jgi:hypothetical protein
MKVSNCCTSSVLVWRALIYSDPEELMHFTPHFHNLTWCRFLHCTISTICRSRGSNICSCKLCPVQVLPVALHMCECRCTSEWQNLCKVKLDVWISKSDVDILGCSCRPFSVCVCLVLEPGTEARAKSGFVGALLGSHNSWHAAREKEKKQDRLLHSPSRAFECDPGYQHLKPTLIAILQYKAVGFSNPERAWNSNVA